MRTLKCENIVEKVRKRMQDRKEVRRATAGAIIKPNLANIGRKQQKMSAVTNSVNASTLSEQTN